MTDLQKANMYKRISAALFDVIMLFILITGCCFLMGAIVGYTGHYEEYEKAYDAAYEKYEAEYGVTFDITEEEYSALTEEERAKYDAASDAFSHDKEATAAYTLLFNLTLIILSFGILLAYMILEFILPLIFKNGQTLGKKMFGIAVMQTTGVKIQPVALFARTVLGKYTLETMIPVFIVIMILFNQLGITGTIVIGLIIILEIVVMIVSRTRSCIHDLLASTVVVDYASQMIFDSPEAMLEYKKKIHAQQVEEKDKQLYRKKLYSEQAVEEQVYERISIDNTDNTDNADQSDW